MIKIIPGPEFNKTVLNFDWEVLEITENEIEIQILFDYPLSVSTGTDQLEKFLSNFNGPRWIIWQQTDQDSR